MLFIKLSDIFGEIIEAVMSFYLKLYKAWLIADAILTMFGLIILMMTQSLDTFSDLMINAAIGAIPPPLQLIAIWGIDPFGLIAHSVLSLIIFVILESRS